MKKNIPANTSTFRYFKANTKDKTTNDCVIRTFALAMSKEWDTVFDELCILSHEEKLMHNDKTLTKKYLDKMGWKKQPQPKKESGKKYTGAEWCRKLTKENSPYSHIIINIGGHHKACILKIDGKFLIHDTWDSSEYCIGNFWIKPE